MQLKTTRERIAKLFWSLLFVVTGESLETF